MSDTSTQNQRPLGPEIPVAINSELLFQQVTTARDALEMITTDERERAIIDAARTRISGITELDGLDQAGERLKIKVITALRAAEKLIQNGKARINDPEISLELIQGWQSDLERNVPTRVYRIHTSLLDIMRSIEPV